MSQEPTGPGGEEQPAGSVLQEIDSDLNIFALANGTDLLRDPAGRPERIFEWYRDGMERHIIVTPAADSPDGAIDLAVGARLRQDGAYRSLRRPFRASVAPGELRAALPLAIDAANELTRDAVESEGEPG